VSAVSRRSSSSQRRSTARPERTDELVDTISERPLGSDLNIDLVAVKQLSDQNNLSAARVRMLELKIDMIKQPQALIDAQNGKTK
jgi:hypothetical protein